MAEDHMRPAAERATAANVKGSSGHGLRNVQTVDDIYADVQVDCDIGQASLCASLELLFNTLKTKEAERSQCQ